MKPHVTFHLRYVTWGDISVLSDGETNPVSPLAKPERKEMAISIRLRIWKVKVSFTIEI